MSFLGRKIREYRKQEQLSQVLVAESMGIKKQYLNRIEREETNPTQEMAHRILVQGFDMSPSQSSNILNEWLTEEINQKYPRKETPEAKNTMKTGDVSGVVIGSVDGGSKIILTVPEKKSGKEEFIKITKIMKRLQEDPEIFDPIIEDN